MRDGDIHLPYGYDPIWHSPSQIPMADRTYDLALIGLQYPQRIQLVNIMRSHGKNVFFELGQVYDEAREIYHQTRIGFNWSSLKDTTARCFEVMAMGNLPLLNRVPDLVSMFRDGEEYVGFDSLDEAIDNALYFLENPEEAERISERAKKAVAPHTWDARMTRVLQETGLLNG